MGTPAQGGGRNAPARSKFGEGTDRGANGAGEMSGRVQVVENTANVVGAVSKNEGFGQTGKMLGRVGDGLDFANAQAGYMRDTRTMSADEAFVKNYGSWGLNKAGAYMGAGVGGAIGGAGAGAATGGPGAPFGVAAGGAVGYELGRRATKPAADNVLPAYQAVKKYGKYTLDEWRERARMYAVLADPRYMLRRRGLPVVFR